MPMMMTRMQSSPSSQQLTQQNARRVSFEDTNKPSSKRRFVGLTGGSQRSRGIISSTNNKLTASPIAIHPSSASIPIYNSTTHVSTEATTSHSAATTSFSPQTKMNQVTVLHGRLIKKEQPQQKEITPVREEINKQRHSFTKRMSDMRMERSTPHHQFHGVVRGPSIRDLLERKAVYATLREETKQFQQQVAALENVLKKEHHHVPLTKTDDLPSMSTTGHNAETGWRIRLLLKKAQDTDTILWKKLYEYEKTLLDEYQNQTFGDSTEIRDLQTSCMKLHRDFKRCHKSLLMCLSLLEDDDTHRLMKDITDPEHSVVISPIVEAVGWTGMITTIDKCHKISNTDTVILHNSGINHDNSNIKLDEDRSLSRSISPIPAYTSFRQVKETGRDTRKSKQKKIIEYDDYDEFQEDDDYNICQDKFYDALMSYCSTSRCHGTTSRRNDTDDDNDDDEDPQLFWICSDLLDLAHNNQKVENNTSRSNKKGQASDCHGAEDFECNKRPTSNSDTDDTMCKNDDINNFDSESYKSTKYKWFQQIQDNMHSMQIDLLHFRSRSLNRHRYYDDTIDNVPEYTCGGTNGKTNRSNKNKTMNGRHRNNVSDDISSTCNSSDAPMDES